MNKPSTNSTKRERINDALRKRILFYKEENAMFETIYNNCKLLDEPSSSWNLDLDWNMHKEVDKLCSFVEHFGITELDPTALAMAYIDQKYEESNITERFKSDTKLYMSLNDELQKDIEQLSRDLDESRKESQTAFDVTNEDVYMVDKKIAAYENEISKFEKKHSWLKNPQLDLTYIAKEAQTLSSMKEEKEALEKELDVYQGLQPDMQEASHQLSVVKKQYQEIKDKRSAFLSH